MAKRSLSQQLDEAIEALLSYRGARPGPSAHAEPGLQPADPRLAELLGLAADLRDLPREDFRERLKTDFERRKSMTTSAAAPQAAKAKYIPEGYHTATPYLIIKDAGKAIEFYKKAFGAAEVLRMEQPDGRIRHAEIKIGDSHIMLADEFPEMGYPSPQSLGGSAVSILLYVEDVDATASQAIAAGLKVLRPVQDQFYGDRSGNFADPFGHLWSIATHKEDLSPEELRRRAKAYMERQRGEAAPRQEPAAEGATRPGVRPGFNSITPYLTVQRAAELVDFLKRAFGATETFRTTGSAGGLHAEVKIGDSILMMGGFEGMPFPETPASLHFYVNDADAVYQRALEAGAASLEKPVDQAYGDREAGVKDPFGNLWWIATHQGAAGPIPEGLRAVTPYLLPRGAPGMIDFLKQAFGAEEVARYAGPDGTIHHAKVRIGDSMLEMGEARGPYQPMPAAIYLYVKDVDATYQRALQAGAVSAQEPADQPYGDRNAWVKDPFGHTWYIATHIRDVVAS